MFPALQVMMINHSYWLSFCTTAPLTNTSPSILWAWVHWEQRQKRRTRLKHLQSAGRGGLPLTAETHCCFDRGWCSTGCSWLYLWPHYQRAAAQPQQSNWCFGMWAEKPWAPPLGHGLVGAVHTHRHQLLESQTYNRPFCWEFPSEGMKWSLLPRGVERKRVNVWVTLWSCFLTFVLIRRYKQWDYI